MQKGLASKTTRELKALLAEKGLSQRGNKAELVERLLVDPPGKDTERKINPPSPREKELTPPTPKTPTVNLDLFQSLFDTEIPPKTPTRVLDCSGITSQKLDLVNIIEEDTDIVIQTGQKPGRDRRRPREPGRAKKPKPHKPGDWICNLCGEHNHTNRTRCFNRSCRAEPEDKAPEQLPRRSSPAFFDFHDEITPTEKYFDSLDGSPHAIPQNVDIEMKDDIEITGVGKRPFTRKSSNPRMTKKSESQEHRRNSDPIQKKNSSDRENLLRPHKSDPIERSSSGASQTRILDVWLIDYNELTIHEQVGAGSYGVVKRGSWREADVAVKILIHAEGQEEQFLREAELLCKLRHPNIVNCLGICSAPNKCIVMEFLPNNLFIEIQKGPMPFSLALSIAKGISIGLNFLHESTPQILHRDLKPGNILLDRSLNARIADFGISREREKNLGTMSMTKIGTPVYTAPEIHNNKRYNHKVDIYSFGMVLYAMVAGCSPYKNLKLSNFQICVRLAIKNERPKIPPSTHAGLTKVIQLCWHPHPNHRPDASTVRADLLPACIIKMLRSCEENQGNQEKVFSFVESPTQTQIISIDESMESQSGDDDELVCESPSLVVTGATSEPGKRKRPIKRSSSTKQTLKKPRSHGPPQKRPSIELDITENGPPPEPFIIDMTENEEDINEQ